MNYTIFHQKICYDYERVDALDAYSIDFSENVNLGCGTGWYKNRQKEALQEITDNFTNVLEIKSFEIESTIPNNPTHLFTKSGLDLLSNNLSVKVLDRNNGEYLYGYTQDGYICYFSDGVSSDIIWDDNYIIIPVYLDKEKEKEKEIKCYLEFDIDFLDIDNPSNVQWKTYPYNDKPIIEQVFPVKYFHIRIFE